MQDPKRNAAILVIAIFVTAVWLPNRSQCAADRGADSIATPAVMAADPSTGELTVSQERPGDDTTTQHSALMSEQPVQVASNRPPSPIRWTDVTFLSTSHRKLTSDPRFTDSVLSLLLESWSPTKTNACVVVHRPFLGLVP